MNERSSRFDIGHFNYLHVSCIDLVFMEVSNEWHFRLNQNCVRTDHNPLNMQEATEATPTETRPPTDLPQLNPKNLTPPSQP